MGDAQQGYGSAATPCDEGTGACDKGSCGCAPGDGSLVSGRFYNTLLNGRYCDYTSFYVNDVFMFLVVYRGFAGDYWFEYWAVPGSQRAQYFNHNMKPYIS